MDKIFTWKAGLNPALDMDNDMKYLNVKLAVQTIRIPGLNSGLDSSTSTSGEIIPVYQLNFLTTGEICIK